MLELANIHLQRLLIITISFIVLSILLLAPVVQAHNANIVAQVQASYANQDTQVKYEDPDVFSAALSHMGDNAGHALHAVRLNVLGTIMRASAEITSFDKGATQSAHTAAVLTSHAIGSSVSFTSHVIGSGVTITTHVIGDSLSFGLHGAGHITSFTLDKFDSGFRLLGGITHASALIQVSDNTPTPTIKEMRAQEASIIQKGTIAVAAAQAAKVTQAAQAVSTGAGGACDSGEGNGGYPANWCSAPMDSIPTVPYTSDRINRECTSYAYWFFANVEGHTDFHATGNAKYWAATSNYPTHVSPAIGAIAVETAGAYGHVAIVQALPGQIYNGQVVPAGYVLVSEMNYDWHGHFRYSYSPLSKFTAYIYP